MIWRIYSFFLWVFLHGNGNIGEMRVLITSASPSTNPCLMPIEVELSLGGGPLLQESFKANDGQENSRISHSHSCRFSWKLYPACSPTKKTGMYPSLITLSCVKEPSLSENTGLAIGLLSWENQEHFLVWVRGISKEMNKHIGGKFGACLIQ